MGRPENFPWTTGGIPSYTVEAKVWVEFIKQKFPDAKKVAILSFNNDFGKTYKTTLDQALPAAGYTIVADVAHEATSDLSNEVTQLLAGGPDVIIGGTTSTFCTNLMTLARQGGFTGPIINSYTCQSIQQFMVPAGEAAANVYTLVVAKDPSDPAYADDPAVKQYIADVGTYGPGIDPKVGNVFTGYNAGFFTLGTAYPCREDGRRADPSQPDERVLVVQPGGSDRHRRHRPCGRHQGRLHRRVRRDVRV